MIVKKITWLLILVFLPHHQSFTASYGSDTSVSLLGSSAATIPTSVDNIINSFGYADGGFGFTDASTSCSFNSVFPVSGPITLKGGTLWLNRDLMLTNLGSITDLGVVKGQGHVLSFAPCQTGLFGQTSTQNIRLFQTKAQVTQARTVYSADWSYDNNYLAMVIASGGGSELFIYSFNGIALTLATSADLGGTGNCVRWHPGKYVLAVGTNVTASRVRIFTFSAPNTLTSTLSINPGATINAVAWQGRGKYLAAGGVALIKAYSFTDNTYGTLSTTYSTTNTVGTVNTNAMVCAPVGNKDDLIAGTSAAAGNNFFIYNIPPSTNSTANLTLTANYSLDTSGINGLDLASTGTYLAIAFAGASNNVGIYKYQVSDNTITPGTTFSMPIAAKTVSWKNGAHELVAGTLANASGNEFVSLNFSATNPLDPKTYQLNQAASCDVPAGINFLRYQQTSPGDYLVRVDNTTFVVSILNETTKPFNIDNTELILNNDLILGSPLSFTNSCTINGQGNILTITGNSGIYIANNATVKAQQIKFNIQTPSAFTLQSQTSKLILENSLLNLNSDILFANGSLQTYGDVTITGPQNFYLSSYQTSTIHAQSQLNIENHARFNVGRTPLSGSEPLEFEDTSASLNLNDGMLVVTGSGLTLKKGTFNIYNECGFDINLLPTDGDSVSNRIQGLILGDGLVENNVDVKLHGNGASLTITSGGDQGSFVINAPTSDTIKFYGQAELSLDATSSMYLPHITSFTNGWLNVETPNSLYIAPSACLLGENLRYTNNSLSEDFIVTGTFRNLNTIILDNGGNLTLNHGYIDQNITINRHNNIISGIGNINGEITLNDVHTSLSIDVITTFETNNLSLNHGLLILNKDVAFAHNYVIEGDGTVQLNGRAITFGNQDSIWTGTLYFDGDQSRMDFNANVKLTGKWTFSRDCVVDGHGYTIDLSNTGTIVVEHGSSLTLRNMTIENLSRNNDLIAADNQSNLTLDNVNLILAGGYKWQTGKINFVNDVSFIKCQALDLVHTFSYESPITSSIATNSRVKILDKVNLEIGRFDTTTNIQPLEFTDETSALDLWGGSLTITTSGITITKGTIHNYEASTIDIKAQKTDHGLILGDGNANNDARIKIGCSGGTTLTINNGRIVYNNSNPTNRITFDNNRANLNFLNNAGITSRQSLTLQDGVIHYPGKSTLVQEAGTKLAQLNMSHIHDVPYATHKLSSSNLDHYTIARGGSYMTTEGVSEVGTTIEGVPGTSLTFEPGYEMLGGAGKVSCDVTLTDNTTTLSVMLIPSLAGNIFLNGGALNLIDEFKFADGYNFQGSGRIKLNAERLRFGQTDLTLTNTLTIEATNGQLELNSSLDIRGLWTFAGGSCTINGRANILDFTHGGMISIAPNTTLILDNVIVKGLGSRFNNFIFRDATSHLRLFNSSIGLANNITTTNGGIYVAGSSTIALRNHNWTFDQNSSLTIDGAVLWKEPLGASTCGDILFGPGDQTKYLTLLNTGTIKLATNGDLVMSATQKLGTEISAITPMTGNINLTSHNLELNNDCMFSSKAYLTSGGIVDANGYALVLSSSLVIPDHTTIKITSNLLIDGNGNNFVVGQGAQLIIDPNISVTLRNVNWFNSNSEPHLQMRAATSQLTLDSVTTGFDRNFSFTQGKLFINNDVHITGTNQFTYASLQPMYIGPWSRLHFDVNSTFSFSPGPSGPHTIAQRNLVKLADRSSQLYLNNCIVNVPDAGMQLTRGSIIFGDRVTLHGTLLELGDGELKENDVDVTVLSGADIVNNNLIYYHPA